MASQLDNLASLTDWNLPLRIQRRGQFFTDDGFQDYRRHFESAVNDLLQEFDFSRSDNSFNSYRRLRDRQMSGTDRAAKVAEETDKYKIVMDVEGFKDGDFSVIVSGPNEITVEGTQEITGTGNFFNRSFKRRFALPGLALVQDASSVVSTDNVLTISVPKKIQEVPLKSSEQNFTSTQRTTESQNLETKVKDVFQKLKDDSRTSFALDDFHKRSLASDTLLDFEIVPRQSFFNDSFFENVRPNFQKSVDDFIERKRRISSTPELGFFQKVRTTKEDNAQAVSVTEDAREHKIVLDVHGFSEGDLKVRAVSECELRVEGKVEKKTRYTSCAQSFSRRFTLPSSVNIRQATSALSSEGILTISVPKKLETIDYNIPVRSEAASNISNVIKKEQEKTSTTSKIHMVPITQEEQITSRTNQNVVQEEQITSRTNQNVQQQAATNVTQTTHSTTKVTDSCALSASGKKEHYVPISTEDETVSEDTKETTFAREPSELIKESQRLVSESAKLIEELNASSRSTPGEHYVPVELESGVNIDTQLKSDTDTRQSTTKDIFSSTACTQSTPLSTIPEPLKSRPSSGRIVPISLKGSFYNESIFDDARQSIEKEVQDVFSKYHQTSDVKKQTEETKTLQTTTQDSESLIKNGQTTSTILEDAHNYKIVLDVFGFEERELKVKVSGVNEVSVEGNSEKAKGGALTKHNFQRTFQLPDCIDLERVVTALSEERILTITVPKKNQLLPLQDGSSTRSSKLSKHVTKSQEEKSTLVVDSSGIVQEKRCNIPEPTPATSFTVTSPPSMSSTSTTISESINKTREYVVPVSLEDVSDVASEARSVRSTSLASQVSTASATSRDVPQNILSTSTSASSVDTQIQSKSTSAGENIIEIQGIDSSKEDKASTILDQTREITTKPLFNLPIVPRGHFFDDSFFQDSRSMFETLLRNKMSRFNRSMSFVDDVDFFKSLRDRRITGGSQVDTFSEDDQFHKIVFDVSGFDEKNLKVKALSDNEIVIEGEMEEKSGNSISRKSFRKQFILPGNVDLRGASSALSSDGVLNIKIPKKL